MEPRTTIVALDSKRASNVLHGEIVTNCSRTIADEVKCCREATTREEVMKEIVERPLTQNVKTRAI